MSLWLVIGGKDLGKMKRLTGGEGANVGSCLTCLAKRDQNQNMMIFLDCVLC